jgi:hypothetical protein
MGAVYIMIGISRTKNKTSWGIEVSKFLLWGNIFFGIKLCGYIYLIYEL